MASQLQLTVACHALAAGGVIAYPTEGVWGLGCEPWDARACARLLRLKRRPVHRGLIVIADDFEALTPLIRIPSNTAMKRAFDTWPGPATWTFPAGDDAPYWLTGDHDTLAIRVTAHPVAAALCARYGGPIVSTSANLAGEAPRTSAALVRLRFPGQLDAVVPGALGGLDRPTMIRDVRTGAILRQ